MTKLSKSYEILAISLLQLLTFMSMYALSATIAWKNKGKALTRQSLNGKIVLFQKCTIHHDCTVINTRHSGFVFNIIVHIGRCNCKWFVTMWTWFLMIFVSQMLEVMTWKRFTVRNLYVLNKEYSTGRRLSLKNDQGWKEE